MTSFFLVVASFIILFIIVVFDVVVVVDLLRLIMGAAPSPWQAIRIPNSTISPTRKEEKVLGTTR